MGNHLRSKNCKSIIETDVESKIYNVSHVFRVVGGGGGNKPHSP